MSSVYFADAETQLTHRNILPHILILVLNVLLPPSLPPCCIYYWILVLQIVVLYLSSFCVICVCFSEEQAKLAARKYARIIQKLGFEVSQLIEVVSP